MNRLDGVYLAGDWIADCAGEPIEVVNPATETAFARVSTGGGGEVDAAVKAARAALPDWSATSVERRLACLANIGAGLAARREALAASITREMGAPSRSVYRDQVDPVPAMLADFTQVAEAYPFERRENDTVIVREPIGVCGLITPWNFPLVQIAGKLFPALAAGCTVVLKPSEIAPLNALILAEIVNDTDLPPGVFNLVNGSGAETGAALAAHPDVDMLSLTGSTRAGASVSAAAARSIKRVTLELGGKSPYIICDDADLQASVEACVDGCFGNSGQCCDAPTRMLVPTAMQWEAARIAVDAAQAYRLGDPARAETKLGPVASLAQYERVTGLIRRGVAEGARLMTGGADRPWGLNSGYFVQPTVFAGVDNTMTIAQEEIFGPVLCILSYEDEQDAVRIANDTRYGLAAYIATPDRDRAACMARRLRAGQVRMQRAAFASLAPFGGYKMSGNGRELGPMGFEEYLETKALIGFGN